MPLLALATIAASANPLNQESSSKATIMNQHTPDPRSLHQLFDSNRDWAKSMLERDPDFFNKLSNQQSPEYLWIGCADSRVPPNELVNLMPGEIFVHRNVANVVVHSDLNCLSVLQFAIDVLKVKHVIVCGHYGCGGVHAAMTNRRVGLTDNWLRHVQDVCQKHGRYLGSVLPEKEKADRLCELNVIEQVSNVCQTTIVQDAWERGQKLTIHGWVYGVHDGLLRDLGVTVDSAEELSGKLNESYARYES
ncbi:MAG: cynT2 [Paucimonas sp.]|nr:cynT2 [Paucimonas sp.]